MSIFFINIFFSGQGYADPDRRLHEDRWVSDVTCEISGNLAISDQNSEYRTITRL